MTHLRLAMIIILAACLFAILITAGCGEREAQQPAAPETTPEQPQAEQPTAPEGAPAELAQADAQAGKQIFQEKCASCHGETGKPTAAFAEQSPDFSSAEYDDTPAQDIFNATKNGQGQAMPAYKDQLTDEQIWNVTAYIKTL